MYKKNKTTKLKFTKIFILLFFIGFYFPIHIIKAQTPTTPQSAEQTADDSIDNVEISKKFQEIQKSLSNTQQDLSKSLSETSSLEQRLGDATELINTLEGQLRNIDEQIDKTERRIVLISLNIQRNEEKIEALLEEIKLLTKHIDLKTKEFKAAILTLYFQAESTGYFDSYEMQTIKLLLSDEKVSEMLDKVDSLATLEFSLSNLIKSLTHAKNKLENDKKMIEQTTEQLNTLKNKLDSELLYASLQRNSKQSILVATQGEERLYKQLLTSAREEQIEIRQELINLLAVHSTYSDILNQDGFATENFNLKGLLSWPIMPSLGISAYFKDNSYKAALGVEHYAIDIRTPQGTTVTAPADGVVLKTKSGDGTDYHYIVIGHNSEVMTLFGHMYDVFVRPGQTVKRGDPIGLSGGMPGTRGAGYLTTGPHLHFEVFKEGKHIDPLVLLDPSGLPSRYR